jgi:putative ABC transport system permease protein
VMSSYLYLPAGPGDQRRLGVLLRSQTNPASLVATVRAATQELDPGILVGVAPLESNLEVWRRGSSLVAGLSAVVSLLALLLASAGVYGVVSFVVSRRRREVAIRMALGAGAAGVGRLILAQTLRPVIAGLVLGIAAAALSSRELERVLFGVSRLDPIAFVAVPTRRAAAIDPMLILRRD